MEICRIVLSALTTSGIFSIIFIDKYWLKIITSIISMVSLFINSYFKVYDLKAIQKHHKQSAIELLELRENLIAILCDIKLGKYNEETLIKKRDEVLKKQIDIYKKCLDASSKAVTKASENLKDRGDNTYTDEEINSFLPILARKNK